MTILTFTKEEMSKVQRGVRCDRNVHGITVNIAVARRGAKCGVFAPNVRTLVIKLSREDRDRLARDGGTHDVDVAGQTIRIEVS